MLGLVLAAALSSQEATVKVAAPGFSGVGIEPALVDVWLDRFITRFSRGGIRVTSRKDIEQVIGLERQRALLGCGDSSSCLAELAGALGVDAVLTGSIAKSGGGFTVTVRVVKASDGSELASSSERLKTEDALQDWLDSEAPALADLTRERLSPVRAGPVAVEARGSGPLPKLRWGLGVLGAAVLAGGLVSFGVSANEARRLGSTTPGQFQNLDEIDASRRTGVTAQWLGVALTAVGALCIAAFVLWLGLGSGG